MAGLEKAAGPLARLDGLDATELRALIGEAERRLRERPAPGPRAVVSLRADVAAEVASLDGGGQRLEPGVALELLAAPLPLPKLDPDSPLGRRAVQPAARSLLGARVRAAARGRLTVDLAALRRHAAALGWPVAVLRDARAEGWRVEVATPATLALDPDGEAVLLVIGLGPGVDAGAVGRAVLGAAGEEGG